MGISSPVLGLRPGLSPFSRRSKLPNPDNLTWIFCSNDFETSAKNNSTISLASRLFKPNSSNNWSAIFALVSADTFAFPKVFVVSFGQLGCSLNSVGCHAIVDINRSVNEKIDLLFFLSIFSYCFLSFWCLLFALVARVCLRCCFFLFAYLR
jgi:hypothetical protein